MNFFNNKKILILGSTGFTGTWLSLFLLLLNAKVYGISLKEKKNKFFNYLSLRNKITQYYFNILNEKKLKKIIINIKPDIIIHLASQSLVGEAYKNPKKTIETNILGLTNLLEILKNNSLRKRISVLIATSDKCYIPSNKKLSEKAPLGGNEIYSISKATQELITYGYYKTYLKKKDIIITTCRAGNIIGPGDYNYGRLIPDILNSIFRKKRLIIRNNSNSRPWQSILFCCYHYLLILEFLNKKNIKFSNWNVGPKKSLKVQSIINYITKIKLLSKNRIVYKKSLLQETNKLTLNNEKLYRNFKINKKKKRLDALKFTINEAIILEKLKKNPKKLYLHFTNIIKNYLEIV